MPERRKCTQGRSLSTILTVHTISYAEQKAASSSGEPDGRYCRGGSGNSRERGPGGPLGCDGRCTRGSFRSWPQYYREGPEPPGEEGSALGGGASGFTRT